MKSTASRLDPNWRPEEHVVHEPEARLSDVVPDASQIMAGTGLQGDETTAGSWVRIVEGSVPRVGMYVCLEFYAVAARLEEHMPELVRVGQSWGRGGPKEQPKSDLMGKRARRGEEGPPESRDQAGDFSGLRRSGSALEALDARSGLQGGGPEAIRIKLFSKGPRRRAPPGARPLGQSYDSLAPCGFLLAGQHSSSHRD